jgi:hypothetical protein
MSLDTLYHCGLHFILHRLSAEVLIEHSGSPAECVLLVLKVVIFHVIDETSAHVFMVCARSQSGEKLGASLFMKIGA